MRAFFFVVLLSISAAPVVCQSSAQENLDHIVRAALDPKSSALGWGFTEGPLNRSGDAAAVAITRVVAGKDLAPDDVNRILIVIQKAFAAPRIVENTFDREPRTTLFVLKYLDSLPLSPELKGRIAQTRDYVQRATMPAASTSPK